MPDENDSYPMPNTKDKVKVGGKIGAGLGGTIIGAIFSIPGLGMVASEGIGKIFPSTLDKRRANFINNMAAELDKLKREKGVRIEELPNNELFVTVVSQALLIAVRNHEEEKLQALTNAVINTAKPIFSDDTLYLMFLNWIEAIQALHSRVLRFVFYDKPNSVTQNDTLIGRYKKEHPGDDVDFDLFNQVLKDLSDRGILKIESLRTVDKGETAVLAKVTNIGKDFLAFITEGTLNG